QFYFYNVKNWLKGDNPESPPPESRYNIRNTHWEHLSANHVISMPDKWEYPWFASWDLAFQSVALSLVDFEFAKDQIHLVLSHLYQHPNGQVPAYEWEFSDLNPPVQAWALRRIYARGKKTKLQNDTEFLKRCFLKLMRNFGWWVNKVDREGNNFFEGGFLGLDNISVLDRDKPLSNGGHLEESDGTGWMGFFSLNMLKIALELSKKDPVFEGLAICFFEYFVYIAIAMQPSKNRPTSMWDDKDGFFYDVLSYPNGEHKSLKVRSFVGVIPFYSLDFLEEDEIKTLPKFHRHFTMFLQNNPEMVENCVSTLTQDGKTIYLFSLMTVGQIRRFFQKIFDPNEFFSDHGLRSLSKFHEKNPLFFEQNHICYEPGEALEKIKGGNSNWRGPIWLPTNYLALGSLLKLRKVFGDSMEFDIGGIPTSLKTLSDTLRDRLISLFREDKSGKRPCHGDYLRYKDDPYWKDLILFYEHYHGGTGRGLGASHQTGWSGLVANLIDDLD
ncbi:MAG: glucosidase, partial [Verrucomicrobia bacterium]|nr:glucosidase [Verrucomicrobiota bacterium]